MNRNRSVLPLFLAAAGLMLAAVALLLLLKGDLSQYLPGGSTSQARGADAGSDGSTDLMNGSPAPDFELATLDGELLKLSDLKGSPVLINYWATWCPPCRAELPYFQKRLEKYPDLVVLAVNAGEDPQTVRDFIDKNGFTFTVLLDPEWQLESLFGIMAYPTSIFVDKDGIIRHRVVGGVVPSELDEYLTSIGVGE